MDKSTKTVLGILAAGAIGIAIGMLLAPDKGENTRKKVKDSLGDLDDKLDDFLENVKTKGNEIIADLKDKATTIKDDVDNAIKNA
jgi:gas vesicle protein